jgi:DNA-binding GntR family transcriptional regulator
MTVKNTREQTTKQLMSETVYQALREIIVSRRFEAGQRLNVEELARELKVSRTPVWEAIRRLGQERILHNIPNRGVFMAERPLERVHDILEVRSALDRLACGLAVENVGRPVLDKISRCLPEQLSALEAADTTAYYRADIKFHRLITEASGNSYLTGLYESITAHVFPTPFDILALLPKLYIVHQEIVAGLSNRDHEQVDRAITQHGDLLKAHVKDQIASEAQRKALVQRIKDDSPHMVRTLKRKKQDR